jgi:Flp pilus assembly protein TadG
MFAVLAAGMLFAVAIAVDGGRKLGAISEARDLADNAARAGAQMIDDTIYRTTGTPTLAPAAATARAQDYLASTGHHGTVRVTGSTVTVTVTIDVAGMFLPATTVSVTETAEAVTGTP